MTRPGFLAEQRFMPVGFQAVADAGADATLPDDRVGDRAAGFAIPEDRRLPLVGDAHGGHVARIGRPTSSSTPRATSSCDCQISSGSCSTMPGRGQDLRKLLLCDGADATVVAEQDRPAGSRSLIERQHELRHPSTPSFGSSQIEIPRRQRPRSSQRRSRRHAAANQQIINPARQAARRPSGPRSAPTTSHCWPETLRSPSQRSR